MSRRIYTCTYSVVCGATSTSLLILLGSTLESLDRLLLSASLALRIVATPLPPNTAVLCLP
ncbi:hypothetical protein SODALDRAFT_361136 [Sodiomyces alkalinus F11]|uniref:Uncharacterized protein n=1 Tax=Sodiomyces alkalinus (strain CBS 110278 / VKM F-3762 / F11) TaxID=1314773 RepID=A0A3N2PSE6_SODAK|nr:hypothetical protein SODALDRAFT_361136 [Sodiomyces alkalinus F11]ROT37425.1 hypothetical protein SODALDRAFT_361136 [Sodiomyces alkalinus F11]